MTALHFLGPDGVLPHFPTRADLQTLGNMRECSVLREVLVSISQARKRLWILDLHFHPLGFHGISEVLAVAQVEEVTLVTGGVDRKLKVRLLQELRETIEIAWNQGRPKHQFRAAQCRLAWLDRLERKGCYPYLHDRFLVADDNLWHFGLSAGGSGNRLSAASGPWSAANTRADLFFSQLIQGFQR